MSIERLRYFAAVVETKNLRKASELVGIAPPSMSKAIAVLESELAVKLIHPEGRGIGITPQGIEVYKNSIPLLEENRKFYEKLKIGSVIPDRIRMASFEVFSSYFISSFLKKEGFAGFVLLEKAPGMIERAILDGSADFGLTYVPVPESGLEYRPIGTFEMRIFGQSKWEQKPFAEWPFAIPTTELKIHSSAIDSMDMWPKKAPARTVSYQFELLETALQTSRAGLSVLHCPSFIAKLHNEEVKPNLQLQALKFPSGYQSSKPIGAYLVCRKGAIDSGLERKLARFMRSLK